MNKAKTIKENRILCYEILILLMKADPKATCDKFFYQKGVDVQNIISNFIKEVCEAADTSYQ